MAMGLFMLALAKMLFATGLLTQLIRSGRHFPLNLTR